MTRSRLGWATAAALAILVLGGHLSPGGAGWLGAWAAEVQKAASVEGFRSARFDMTEAQVRKALMKDFGVAEDDIGRSVNSVEKTTSLVINVDDIIPDSGRAVVGYIFGYQTKKLIQVNIVWGGDTEATATAANLVATANILRTYFLEQGFPQDKVITNARLKDGSIVVFRGIDDKGRVAVLQLTVTSTGVGEESSAEQEVSLRLSYIVDPANPDIFKVEAGAF